MCCSILWVNTTVTSPPSARGPDQLSPLLSFKTCLIGFPECPGRGERGRASLLRALLFQRREGGQGSLISHRWTPPVAINQSQSPTGARRGSEEGREEREAQPGAFPGPHWHPLIGNLNRQTQTLLPPLPPQVRGYTQVQPPASPPPLL